MQGDTEGRQLQLMEFIFLVSKQRLGFHFVAVVLTICSFSLARQWKSIYKIICVSFYEIHSLCNKFGELLFALSILQKINRYSFDGA